MDRHNETEVLMDRGECLVYALPWPCIRTNVPMNLGIPALTIGGGSGSGAHSLSESFNIKDSWLGTQRGLLLAVALAR